MLKRASGRGGSGEGDSHVKEGNDACREFEHGSKVPLQPRKGYVIDLFLLFYFHLFFICFLAIFHSVHAHILRRKYLFG